MFGLRLRKEREVATPGPIAAMAVGIVRTAVLVKCSAVAIGYRDPGADAEAIAEWGRWLRETVGAAAGPMDSHDVSPRDTRLTGPDGCGEVPVWFDTPEGLKVMNVIPVATYPIVLSAFEDWLVAIDKGSGSAGPRRYIEITDDYIDPKDVRRTLKRAGMLEKMPPDVMAFHDARRPPTVRQFAEIDIEMDRSNLFWIRIRSVRVEGLDVRIFRHGY